MTFDEFDAYRKCASLLHKRIQAQSDATPQDLRTLDQYLEELGLVEQLPGWSNATSKSLNDKFPVHASMQKLRYSEILKTPFKIVNDTGLVHSLKSTHSPIYITSHIQGPMIRLRYEDGLLKHALLCVDHQEGLDITAYGAVIQSIPIEIPHTKTCEFTGRLQMHAATLAQVNVQRQLKGLPTWLWAHAALEDLLQGGMVDRHILRELAFIPYVASPIDSWHMSPSEWRKCLVEWGFRVAKGKLFESGDLLGIRECIQNLYDDPMQFGGALIYAGDKGPLCPKSLYIFPEPTHVATLGAVTHRVTASGDLTALVHLVNPIRTDKGLIDQIPIRSIEHLKSSHYVPGGAVRVDMQSKFTVKLRDPVAYPDEEFQPYQLPQVCPSCQTPLVLQRKHLHCSNRACIGRRVSEIVRAVAPSRLNLTGLSEDCIRRDVEMYHIDGLFQYLMHISDPSLHLQNHLYQEKLVALGSLLRSGEKGASLRVLSSCQLDQYLPLKLFDQIVELWADDPQKSPLIFLESVLEAHPKEGSSADRHLQQLHVYLQNHHQMLSDVSQFFQTVAVPEVI